MDQTKFLANIARVLAHSCVYFSDHVSGVYAGGGSPMSAQESTAAQLQAYIENLPNLIRVTGENIMPMELALQDASEAISPRKSQQEFDLYSRYAPHFAQVGSQIAGQNALSQSANDLALLQSPQAQSLIRAATDAQRVADPEYYRGRELALGGLSRLFNSLEDPSGGLSGAERAEIDRSLARDNAARGNTNPSNISTVSNAMQFGAAGQARSDAKRAQIANAVNTATGFLPASQSRVDVFQQVTGRPSTNFGEARYSGPSTVGQSTLNMGSNLLGEAGSNVRTSEQLQDNRSALDTIGQITGIAGNVCCWIFLTAHGGSLPWWVRYCRNHLGTEETRRGYKRMAQWLVPLMHRSRLMRWLVRTVMTEPLAMYGGYLVGRSECRHGWVFRPLKRMWFAVWDKLGSSTNK